MLTQRQAQVLRFIEEVNKEEGTSPSYEEIMAHLGLVSKSGVHRIVGALEERGFIRRVKHRRRAIEVIRKVSSIGAVNDDFERGYESGYIKGFDDGVAFVEGGKK